MNLIERKIMFILKDNRKLIYKNIIVAWNNIINLNHSFDLIKTNNYLIFILLIMIWIIKICI